MITHSVTFPGCRSNLNPSTLTLAGYILWRKLTEEQLEDIKEVECGSSTTGLLTGTHVDFVFIDKYFSTLSKTTVLQLYDMYRIDHLVFNYSPQKYLDIGY